MNRAKARSVSAGPRCSEIDAEPSPTPSLTVRDIDDELTLLQATTGGQSVAARRATLHALFGRATEAETDFLRRLLIGELRQGALDGIMAEAIAVAYDVAPDSVRRAAMLTGLLGSAAALARDGGEEALGAVRLTVFQPVLPMLAGSSPSAADAIEACGLSSVEYKLDGARIQVHRAGDAVAVYTRNLNNVTARLPEVVSAALAVDAHEFIVDGEVLGFFDDDRPHAFQDTISQFSTDSQTARPSLVPYFFDCLHVDGTDLPRSPAARAQRRSRSHRTHPLHSPSGDRRTRRRPVVPRRRDCRRTRRCDGESDRFALRRRPQGSVVAQGEAGAHARSGRARRRVGPRSAAGLVVEPPSRRARADDGTFVMVGKTFKGLTDELLRSQTEALLEREQRRDGIVVYVRPELVVEIALDGVQASKRYAGGVALRFARVRRYRADKSPLDADTIDSLRVLLPR